MCGVVCDGAKPSCAFRMFVALFGALEAMRWRKRASVPPTSRALSTTTLKVTLENIYRLQHDVLHNKVDAILWDIVKEQKTIH